ncbi:MAG TPA: GPP34 family phosphoprotein [Actinomycetota bacterium]|nr:GPP34 family phosphoprotein [Actinomycetota bacterium]
MTSLSAEILLLALDDEKGSVGTGVSSTLDTALAGAQLLDLAIAKRITIEDKRVIPLDGPPLDDPVLDAALTRILQESKPKKAESIIPKLTKGLRKRLLAQLADEGVVRADLKKILGFIPINRYPEMDGSVEEKLRERLRRVILLDEVPDERTASLAAVIQAADLESLILNRQERKASKERLKDLAEGEALSPAISHAIASVNAAATAAIVAATSASAASCSAGSSSSSC